MPCPHSGQSPSRQTILPLYSTKNNIGSYGDFVVETDWVVAMKAVFIHLHNRQRSRPIQPQDKERKNPPFLRTVSWTQKGCPSSPAPPGVVEPDTVSSTVLSPIRLRPSHGAKPFHEAGRGRFNPFHHPQGERPRKPRSGEFLAAGNHRAPWKQRRVRHPHRRTTKDREGTRPKGQ